MYPEKGVNGVNLLRESPIIIKPKLMIYSLRAEVLEGNKINVVMPIPGDLENSWSFFKFCGMSVGWNHMPVIGESVHDMHFLADRPGYADLPVYFLGHNTIEIKIFENDDKSPARVKILKW